MTPHSASTLLALAPLAFIAASCQPAPPSTALNAAFVDPSAPAGGDGSRGRPFRLLAEALTLTDPDLSEIALSEGDHELPAQITFTRPRILKGRGADRTRVFTPGGAMRWTVSAPLTLEALTLQGGLSVQGQAPITLHKVAHDDPEKPLEFKDIPKVTAQGLRLRRGGGLILARVGAATLRQVSVEGASAGIQAGEVGQLEATQIAVRRAGGTAISLVDSRATITGLTIEGAARREGSLGDGVQVTRGALTLKDALISDVAHRALSIKLGARVDLEGVRVSRAKLAALYVDMASEVEARGLRASESRTCVLVTSRARLRLEGGSIGPCEAHGMLISDGARVEVTGSTVEGCAKGLISAIGEGVGLSVSTSTLRGAQDMCVNVASTDAPVRLRANTIEGCQGAGVGLLRLSDAILDDNTILGVEANPGLGGDMAHGLAVVDSRVELLGNRVSDTRGVGISLLRASGVLARNTVADTGDVGISIGDPAEDGATLVEGNRVQRATLAGVALINHEATVTGNTISGTRGRLLQGGHGVLLTQGGRGLIIRNSLLDNSGYGIRGPCAGDPKNKENTFKNNNLGDIDGEPCP